MPDRTRTAPSETVIRAWARLMRAQQLALSAVERDLKTAGLPPLVWYDVLLEVERAGSAGLRPFELEQAMLLAQYNLSRLVDRIERAGYVERRICEDDGRGHLVVITDQGKAMRRKMWPVYARGIEAAMGRHLSTKQAEVLDDVLGTLIERQPGKS
ncbi:MAG: MarR family winged helix-turn-helix transcriptional regulator [Hyphomicrobiales bacterium]|nr:MarR family winged helix-turn-helix transcriptional regulator [Hyphomicrobiales bacterium]